MHCSICQNSPSIIHDEDSSYTVSHINSQNGIPHNFHKKCIREWAEAKDFRNVPCPNCMQIIKTSDLIENRDLGPTFIYNLIASVFIITAEAWGRQAMMDTAHETGLSLQKNILSALKNQLPPSQLAPLAKMAECALTNTFRLAIPMCAIALGCSFGDTMAKAAYLVEKRYHSSYIHMFRQKKSQSIGRAITLLHFASWIIKTKKISLSSKVNARGILYGSLIASLHNIWSLYRHKNSYP